MIILMNPPLGAFREWRTRRRTLRFLTRLRALSPKTVVGSSECRSSIFRFRKTNCPSAESSAITLNKSALSFETTQPLHHLVVPLADSPATSRYQAFRMCKLGVLTAVLLAFVIPLSAQTSLAEVLDAVEDNNPTLIAQRQYWQAEALRANIGLTLPNPNVGAEYLIGSPETAGAQTDLSISQGFDLPSAYRKRRDLASAQAGRASSEVATQRQEVLLQAKLICLELTYQFKYAAHLTERRNTLTEIREDFQRRLTTGESNVLDVNKVGLQLLELRQRQEASELEIEQLRLRLTELNGGEAIDYRDTLYPVPLAMPEFALLEAASEEADPERRSLVQQKLIAERQLEVARLSRLPSFSLGYRYQAILGQKFNGLQAGMTLPLWEQKYRVETRQAEILFTDLQLTRFRIGHLAEIQALYNRQPALRASLDEYLEAIASVDNRALLAKALRFGEITTFEYFLETSMYESATLHVLELEHAYYATLARLTKYLL